ncbi:chromatin modification- protein eaf6 [Tilletia horrida]|uniref:Chromatin modification-related protein EAF6 n=1 Tax=Tilletia horrida TaxID=155126 RepID=A0AAN6GT73_9BASI|nr:chromatin modification- protein eaf6 [Tilletia horrida]KAK0552972.1 chromatin modification- protein eaf6 [Tilletia horrida]KAK0566260.1 chromatin modification- protein eaf6 [Tilletia horrida]
MSSSATAGPSSAPQTGPNASTSGSAAVNVTTKEEATTRYLALKSSLKSGLNKKRLIDRTLTDIEQQLWLFEGSYLSATAAAGGNIVKGYDNYLKASTGTGGGSGAGGGSQSRNAAAALAAAAAAGTGPGGIAGSHPEVPLEDRMFSLSSTTYLRSLELSNPEGSGAGSGDKPGSAGLGGGTGTSSSAANRQGSPGDMSVESKEESRANTSSRARKGR